MKKLFVFLLTLLIFVFIFYFITYLESLKNNKPASLRNELSTIPPVLYDKTDSGKLLEIIANRPPLSTQGAAVRLKILEKIGSESGILMTDTDFSLEYVKNAESFIAELQGQDVDFSKQKAINYLKGEGLSESGICNLPLVFYLSPEAAKEYGKKKKSFSPIPEFCIEP